MDCKECGLPIHPYKQIEQEDKEICEFCVLTSENHSDYKNFDQIMFHVLKGHEFEK